MKQGLEVANRSSQMALWSEHVAHCRASGQTVAQWCAAEEIPVSTYYSWQRKLFRQLQEAEGVCFAEVPIPSKSSQSVVATMHSGDLRVELHSGANRVFLQDLVEALKSC